MHESLYRKNKTLISTAYNIPNIIIIMIYLYIYIGIVSIYIYDKRYEERPRDICIEKIFTPVRAIYKITFIYIYE